MKKEIELQFGNARTLIWGGICLGLPPIFNLSLYSLARAGMMPIAAFNAMENDWQVLYRIVLPAVVIMESLAWFFRPFKDGTLQWWFFAGIDRPAHWRRRWIVLLLRVGLFWLIVTGSAVTSLMLIWELAPYPLAESYLSVAVQLGRFALTTLNGLCVCLFWVGVTFLASMGLSRHRFEASVLLALALAASITLAGNVPYGPLAILGGAHSRLFVISSLETSYARRLWLGDLSLLAIAGVLGLIGSRIYDHIGFSPQERRQ